MKNSQKTTLAATVLLGGLLGLLGGCDQSSPSGQVKPVAQDTETKTENATAAPVTPKISTSDTALSSTRTDPKVKPVGPLDASRTTTDDTPARDISAKLGAKADDATSRPARREPPKPPVDNATYAIQIVPATLDLGEIPVGEVGKGTVTLRNTGDTPMMLSQCKTSCGCTTANCPKGEYIAAGGTVDIEITLKGGTTPRQLKKKVTFMFNDDERLLMDVVGKSVAFVSIDPLYIVPERVEDGKVVVKSEDGQAFNITSMTPAILEEFSPEPLEEHVLYLDWEKWKELGSQRKVTFFLDHPKAERIAATIRPITKPSPRPTPERDTATLPMVAVERAIKEGNVAAVIEKLDKGDVKLDSTDRTGQTMLHLAAKYGQTDLVSTLLDRGADIDATDTVGRTALMTVAQAKSPETVRILLEHQASLSPRDLVGSALSWSGGFGDAESTQLLIDAGAELEVAGTATGFTPLIWASGFGAPGSVKALLMADANMETRDLTHGATALMHASRTGNVEKIRILVEAGAELEAKDNTGKTPLLVACDASGATVEMVQALLDAGADLNATDNRKQTALSLANKRTDPRGEAVRALLNTLFEKTGG